MKGNNGEDGKNAQMGIKHIWSSYDPDCKRAHASSREATLLSASDASFTGAGR